MDQQESVDGWWKPQTTCTSYRAPAPPSTQQEACGSSVMMASSSNTKARCSANRNNDSEARGSSMTTAAPTPSLLSPTSAGAISHKRPRSGSLSQRLRQASDMEGQGLLNR